ncbi:hypothetical protein PybrP1_011169 [[Pythium] brassicae (nom. inval.)]|nr:hypothetical protein PybrP1_011169 [[Pythium] brassicae (nom. inval.)]
MAASTSRATLRRLPLVQKSALRAQHAALADLTRRELCEWARVTFTLPRLLVKTTLSDALNQLVQDNGSLTL